MKIIYLLLLILGVCSGMTWDTYKREYDKHYIGEMDLYRKQIWEDNVRTIELWNREEHPFELGINQFTDLTQKEFENIYLGLIQEDN